MAFVSRYDADMDISEGIPCTECEGRFFQTWGQLTSHMFRHHGIRINQLGAWAQQQRQFERRPELLDITEDEMERVDDVPGEPEQFKCVVCRSLGANVYTFQKRNASAHFAKVHKSFGLDTSKWLVVADGTAIKNGAPQNLRLSAALAKHRLQPDAEMRPTDGGDDQPFNEADEMFPGTPSNGNVSSDDPDKHVAKSGKFKLATLSGEGAIYDFDELSSIGWIVSLVLSNDVFGRGDRPRDGHLVFARRVFKPRQFAEKVWQVVDGTGYDDPPPLFMWIFRGESSAETPVQMALG